MTDSAPWHIPRASLGSTSSQGSRRSSLDHKRGASNRAFDASSDPKSRLRERFDDKRVPKRGSRSSQGSSDSAHSSHSAGSGSLLLTAANLENFAKIHHQRSQHPHLPHHTAYSIQEEEPDADPTAANAVYKSNITLARSEVTLDMPPPFRGGLGHKTKDLDSISMASSTHFTVVNGVGRQPKTPKSGLCDRGHQITVLIVTMSVFFMIGICAAVYFMEMRAREMPY